AAPIVAQRRGWGLGGTARTRCGGYPPWRGRGDVFPPPPPGGGRGGGVAPTRAAPVRMTRRDSCGAEAAMETGSEAGSPLIRTIVMPLDGSAFGEQALPYARALAKGLAAPILLVTAVHLDTFIAADTGAATVSAEVLQTIMDDEIAQARDYLT